MSTQTYVDREEASEILKVSTRTIDRYIRKYHFKVRKDGRRVLMKRKDLDRIIQDQIGHFAYFEQAPIGQPSKKQENENETQLQISDIKLEKVTKKESAEERVYRELYNEAKRDLKERQDRLEVATYRVGQLESQLKNMVPLLDYSQKEKELKEAHQAIEHKVLEGKEAVFKMERK